TRCSGQSNPSPDDACRLVEAMTLKQTLEAFEGLDSARASGRTVVELLAPYPAASITVEEVRSDKGKTDFVKIVIAGTQGHRRGGTARTRSASSASSVASGRGPSASASSPTATGRSPRPPLRSKSPGCRWKATRFRVT